MEKKFVKIILAVFVVLAAVASLPYISEKISSKKNEDTRNVSVNLSAFTKESVDKISIKKGEKEKILRYVSGKWMIGEEEADADKVELLFQNFSELKVREMASQNEENHKKFEVDKDAAIRMMVYQGGKASAFFVGKAGVTTGDFYIRRDGIKNVYLVNGNLRDKLVWEAEKWKNEEKKDDVE